MKRVKKETLFLAIQTEAVKLYNDEITYTTFNSNIYKILRRYSIKKVGVK